MKRLLAIALCAFVLAGTAGVIASESRMPEIVTRHLPDAMVGVHYSTRIKADGGGSLSFSVAYVVTERNDFPNALKLSPSGQLSGTPEYPGTLVFTIRATNEVGSGDAVLKLKVLPFDAAKLAAGGQNPAIIGYGNEPYTGAANGTNGGRVAMHGENAYFLDTKGYLYMTEAPFKKAALVYKAREYAWLDVTGDTMVYYQRYLSERAPAAAEGEKKQPDGYVTRLATDPLGKKGRATLAELRRKDVVDLSVTNEVAVYIQDGQIYRVELANGRSAALRAYHEGRELTADKLLPFNGYAYFRGKRDGLIYRMPLDGELASPLTQIKAEAFTVAELDGETVLYFTDNKRQLHVVPAAGGEAWEVPGIKAGALNADGDYVYFTNSAEKYALCRFAPGQDKAETLSDTAAASVYVFDDYIAFEARKGKTLYILPKAGGEKPTKLGK